MYEMETTLDRITLNFGSSELELAREIRKQAGKRGINTFIKQAIRQYLQTQKSK